MTFDIEQMRKNRNGTVSLFWIGETLMAKEFGEVVELFNADWSSLDEFKTENKARIASIPDLEAEIERLTAALETAREVKVKPLEWHALDRYEFGHAFLACGMGIDYEAGVDADGQAYWRYHKVVHATGGIIVGGLEAAKAAAQADYDAHIEACIEKGGDT